MVKLFLLALSIFLITIIFLRIPKDNVGLASFSSSSENFLNILTTFGILLYFLLATVENLKGI